MAVPAYTFAFQTAAFSTAPCTLILTRLSCRRRRMEPVTILLWQSLITVGISESYLIHKTLPTTGRGAARDVDYGRLPFRAFFLTAQVSVGGCVSAPFLTVSPLCRASSNVVAIFGCHVQDKSNTLSQQLFPRDDLMPRIAAESIVFATTR